MPTETTRAQSSARKRAVGPAAPPPHQLAEDAKEQSHGGVALHTHGLHPQTMKHAMNQHDMQTPGSLVGHGLDGAVHLGQQDALAVNLHHLKSTASGCRAWKHG